MNKNDWLKIIALLLLLNFYAFICVAVFKILS